MSTGQIHLQQKHTIPMLALLIVALIISKIRNFLTLFLLLLSFLLQPYLLLLLFLPSFFLPNLPLLPLLLLLLCWLFGCDCGGNWRRTSFLNPFHAAVRNLIRFTFGSTTCFGTWRCTNPALICSPQIGEVGTLPPPIPAPTPLSA